MGSYIEENSASPVKLPTIKFTKLFINGEFVDSVSGLFLYLSIFPNRTEAVLRAHTSISCLIHSPNLFTSSIYDGIFVVSSFQNQHLRYRPSLSLCFIINNRLINISVHRPCLWHPIEHDRFGVSLCCLSI
jgi:hypothetical protein